MSINQNPTYSSRAPNDNVTSSLAYVISKSRKMLRASSAAFVNSSDSKRRWSIPKHDFFCLIISTVRMERKELLKFSMLEYWRRGPEVHLFSKVNKLSGYACSELLLFSNIIISSSSRLGYWNESCSSSVSPLATRRQ